MIPVKWWSCSFKDTVAFEPAFDTQKLSWRSCHLLLYCILLRMRAFSSFISSLSWVLLQYCSSICYEVNESQHSNIHTSADKPWNSIKHNFTVRDDWPCTGYINLSGEEQKWVISVAFVSVVQALSDHIRSDQTTPRTEELSSLIYTEFTVTDENSDVSETVCLFTLQKVKCHPSI